MPRLLEPHEIPVLIRHTWAEWADGQWRAFYQDQDFPEQTVDQFRQCAKKYAARHKLTFASKAYPGDRVDIMMSPRKDASDQRDATEQSTLE